MPTICVVGPSKQRRLLMEGARRPMHLTFHDLQFTQSGSRQDIHTLFKLRSTVQLFGVDVPSSRPLTSVHIRLSRAALRRVGGGKAEGSRRMLSFGGPATALGRSLLQQLPEPRLCQVWSHFCYVTAQRSAFKAGSHLAHRGSRDDLVLARG